MKTVYPLQTKFAGGITNAQTDARTDNVKTVYPLQTKFAGDITSVRHAMYTLQQKKRILFNIHLIQETIIKIYPELYEYD